MILSPTATVLMIVALILTGLGISPKLAFILAIGLCLGFVFWRVAKDRRREDEDRRKRVSEL